MCGAGILSAVGSFGIQIRILQTLAFTMPCIHCLVAGRVQGVYFRASTQREARCLGLTGWVRNLPDGRVEVMASGPHDAIAMLERWLQRGPPAAHVTEVITNSAADDGWLDFSIR